VGTGAVREDCIIQMAAGFRWLRAINHLFGRELGRALHMAMMAHATPFVGKDAGAMPDFGPLYDLVTRWDVDPLLAAMTIAERIDDSPEHRMHVEAMFLAMRRAG